MKKIMMTIMSVLVAANLLAAEHVVERTYLSTDKSCYVAGDNIWLSAFCLDLGEGSFSDFSSIAYVELCSEDGVQATCKIALIDGRGSGALVIPRALPTGNYKLIAYTAQNRNEVGYDFFETSKTISVYNTFTSVRSKTAELVSDEVYASLVESAPQNVGDLSVSLESNRGRVARIKLENTAAKAATFSVSVYHDDQLVSPKNDGVSEFLARNSAAKSPVFENKVVPDFEGEVISGRCVGENAAKYYGNYAVISNPGDLSGIYYSNIEEDGRVFFVTNNYYGDNILVSQIENEEEVQGAHLEFDSPFVDNKASSIASLPLSPMLSKDLELRGTAMQIEKMFTSDTLYERLPYRPNMLLGAAEPRSYILKDYTRFPLMSEVILEFVQGVRFINRDKKHLLHVTLTDASKTLFTSGESLIMIDGTPILDHDKVYDYDPLLVEKIDIYPSTYFIGPRCCNGIVNFVTYKRNMTGLTFPEAVRAVDFQGACWPVAYTCRNVSSDSNYPDYRNTVYWHPLVDVDGGESFVFDCQLPSYEGKFKVVVEGITEDGKPICETFSF
ncbi:MAG: hypothetical protein MJY72_00180 [Bacteroidales bacterium]|nr:hypothetical protein [Bacteroidales bacterium]